MDKALIDVKKKLTASICGLYATHSSIESVSQYAEDLLCSTQSEQMPFMSKITLGIYHNTLVALIIKSVYESIEKFSPWQPRFSSDLSLIENLEYPYVDWQNEVALGDSISGYVEWVNDMLLQENVEVDEDASEST
jgi:hypothetical protein